MPKRVMTNGKFTGLEFTEKKVFDITFFREITEEMIEDVITDGFEGGINYWCDFINYTDDLLADKTVSINEKPDWMPLSTWCANLIIEGKTIQLYVPDKGKYYPLNLESIKKGFEMHLKNYPDLYFNGDADASDADAIIQYAIFGKVVYS